MPGLDAFLEDLFPTPPPPVAAQGIDPALMQDAYARLATGLRDGAAMPNEAGAPLAPQDDALPLAAELNAGAAPSNIPPVNPPMPRPRPAEAGPSAADLLAGRPPGGGMPAADAAQPGPEMMSGSPFAKLAGLTSGLRQPGSIPDGNTDARSVLGRLLGFDQAGEKRARSVLAGGFAGGNPAFRGGAMMAGLSGGLKGGLASDKEDAEAEIASDEKEQKQGNFNRTQTDKEKTSESLRKLYGQRGEALTTSAAARANPAAKGAWNKPPHERYKDAMHLIQNERKALYGQINPLSSPADRTAAKAEADKKLADFTRRTLQTYGIDENGKETGLGQGGRTSSTAPDGASYDSDAITGAREAIARGANADQVRQRLKENGITFSDNDLAL